MVQEIFKRYEKKYLLAPDQYQGLMRELVKRMSADSYGKHTISNIYFDTRDFELIRHSAEKPDYKEKVRLRAYGKPEEESTVYAELKKKYDGVVYKRRIPLIMEEARKYLYYGIYPKEDSQVLKEIDYVMRLYDLKPMAFVAYDRTAFFGNENRELRVTFDRNIRCRNRELDLVKGDYGTCILTENQILMEVKIPGAMPVWMSRMFSQLEIYPVSFSKYGMYYKGILYKNQVSEGRISCA
ncbi:polyphosphate polymerase domain-containing protein [Lacrimispora sp.]|uniref:polyphosphate polymerase domain-containing protein n=1 Tax=Lacrimispora sp. TaxID=2719234 RepID=UPI0028A75FEF|nr:polyphosphate polymerase domain-containing protein [Lacrimispora sp.]